jgi:hypothetical protein
VKTSAKPGIDGPAAAKNVKAIEALEAENAKLVRENRALKVQNEKLARETRALRNRLAAVPLERDIAQRAASWETEKVFRENAGKGGAGRHVETKAATIELANAYVLSRTSKPTRAEVVKAILPEVKRNARPRLSEDRASKTVDGWLKDAIEDGKVLLTPPPRSA